MFNKILAGNCFNAILMILVSSLYCSCAGPKTIADDNLLIELKRTPCYGTCPVYTLRIAKNGKGLFEGVENVQNIGKFGFTLTREELSALEAAFAEARFYQLKNIYNAEVSDLPTTYITYNRNGRKKRIMDYYGAPERLRSLENRIESLVLSKKMKRIR